MKINNDLYLDSLKNELIGDLFKETLNEERGVNRDYLPIGNEIYDALLKKGKVIPMDSGFFYALRNYKPITDAFIDSITIGCFVNVNNITSSFDVKNNVPHLSKELKIKNVSIKLSVKSDENNYKIPDRNDFLINFCHEFHHAYRYWNIINKNNDSLTDNEEMLKNRNANIQNGINNYKFDSESVFDFYYKSFLDYAYYANNDEINAYSSETYEFLRQNPEIDKYDLTSEEFLEKIPSYEPIKMLRDSIVFIDAIYREKEEKRIKEIAMVVAQTICNEVLGFGNVSKQHALMVLRQFFAKSYERQERQFFKVLKNAFVDLNNKNVKENRQMLKNILISKQMNEILNKGRIYN